MGCRNACICGGRCSESCYEAESDFYNKERGNYKASYLKEVLKNKKAKELLKWFVWYFREGSTNLVPYKHKVAEAEQFLSEVEK